jgi:hypothetical protein
MAHRNIGKKPVSRSSEPVSAADADITQLPSGTDDPNIAPERLLALFAAKDLDALILRPVGRSARLDWSRQHPLFQ